MKDRPQREAHSLPSGCVHIDQRCWDPSLKEVMQAFMCMTCVMAQKEVPGEGKFVILWHLENRPVLICYVCFEHTASTGTSLNTAGLLTQLR